MNQNALHSRGGLEGGDRPTFAAARFEGREAFWGMSAPALIGQDP
jgi:hypothetical protein